MKQSEFGKLKTTDFWKGLVVAVFSAVVTALGSAFESLDDLSKFNWQVVVIAAGAGFIGYIGKNLVSNSDGQVLTKEKKVS